VENRREDLEQSLLKRLDRTLNMKKIKRTIPNAIDRALGSLKSRVDPWVEGFFGRRGLAIKKLLGEFVYEPIPVIKFMSFPTNLTVFSLIFSANLLSLPQK